MRVLVTGIGGFAGRHVAAALAAAGHEVEGLVRDADASAAAGLGVRLHRADLLDAASIDAAVAASAPDAVVHLAAWTDAAAAERDVAGVYAANVGGTLAMLGAVRARAPRARLLVVSTMLVYGLVERHELPVREDNPLRPTGIYGASKAAAEVAALQWSRAYELDVVVARAFNHTGPGQRADFVCAAVARQVAAIEAGRQEPVLRVGNVDPVRDFTDVRDVAAAYVALVERGRRGEIYNVCAGEGVSVAEVIALFRTLARIPMRVRSEPARRRPLDVERIVGSHEKIARDTAWGPRIPLVETLRDVLEEWRGGGVGGA